MDHQIELGYLVLELPHPEQISPVLADVVGLVPGESVDGTRTWRWATCVARTSPAASTAGSSLARARW